jgi:hypothetical protein
MTLIAISHASRGVDAAPVPLHIRSDKLIDSVGVRQIEGVRLVHRCRKLRISDVRQILGDASGRVTRHELFDVLGVPERSDLAAPIIQTSEGKALRP